MIKYVFKEGRPLGIKNAKHLNPQKLGEAIAAIKDSTKGRFNSKTALKAVTADSKHYCRGFLEWNDAIAGEAFRLEQMRTLISSIDIVDVDRKGKAKGVPMPAFMSIREPGGRSYHTPVEVMNSAALSALALKQAESDLAAYERRLMSFAEIANAIRHARELIAARRERYGDHPEHA